MTMYDDTLTEAPVAPLDARGQRRDVLRRRLLVLADQGASSASNILVAILVARSFDSPAPFGAFSLAMIAYQVVLSAARAVVGEPLLSLYSHRPASVRRRLVPDVQGATLFIGLLCSLVLWPVAVALGGLSGEAMLALAAVLPVVLIQDTWRYLFVVDRPGAALAVDLVWLALVALALPLAPADAGVTWFVLMWGLGGALGAVLGAVLGFRDLDVPHPWRWLVDHRATSARFLGETTTAQALNPVLMTGLGAISGLGALGAVRAGQVFFGPINTLHAGIYLAVVPEGAAVRDQPERLRRKLTLVSAALASFVAVWTLVGMVLPDRWGQQLFGGTWADAEGLILPLGFAAVGSALLSGGLLGLRSLADAKRSLQTRLRVTPWLIVCPLVGAAAGEAAGFAIGTAIGTALAAFVWWTAFRASLRDRAVAAEPALPG